ncbi:hypothetical protein PN498_12960 [Oscillatoria sp. CS-180]|uniref:choice-of-anchor Y domain-containing protein n=1 Tax=Oscillatoria sp. CS-180 TaxID=3021720 RepID=UPI00232B7E8B|nr:hypothetical protein [Oscillatoria sp. CS-180]MDB9526902.1 hypothetical protein [Oscillatoria sp. CS-180]
MATTLYNPAVNTDILALGQLAYGQIPIFPFFPSLPLSLQSVVYVDIPNLSSDATKSASGTTLNTNGTAFDDAPGYNALTFILSGGNLPPIAPFRFTADANTGYAGYTNYTINLEEIDPNNLDIEFLSNLDESLEFVKVNDNFPDLDPTPGFTVAFDLAISEEASDPNRAGFTVIAVTDDPTKAIEIGFKTEGSDRAFAQSANFTEAENSSATPLDFSVSKTYWLSVSGETYSLAANGVEILTGNLRDYQFDPTTSDPPFPEAANPYETPNFLFWGDNTDQGYSEFTLGKIEVVSLQTPLSPATYDDYIASYGDLIRAFGYNPEAGRLHYLQSGFKEGRVADQFAEDIYLASHGDLIRAFSYNLDAATRHYIQSGFAEERSLKLFFPEIYLAGYEDLQDAFGKDLAAATRHYIESGFREGRDPFLGFDPAAYIASYDDLIAAFGYDLEAGRNHFFQTGISEGRSITFEAADYIASHPDLIEAFGYDLEAGTEHYITFGNGEGRARDLFDEVAYLGKHSDLRAVFEHDPNAATRHYIEFGYAEGREIFC